MLNRLAHINFNLIIAVEMLKVDYIENVGRWKNKFGGDPSGPIPDSPL